MRRHSKVNATIGFWDQQSILLNWYLDGGGMKARFGRYSFITLLILGSWSSDTRLSHVEMEWDLRDQKRPTKSIQLILFLWDLLVYSKKMGFICLISCTRTCKKLLRFCQIFYPTAFDQFQRASNGYQTSLVLCLESVRLYQFPIFHDNYSRSFDRLEISRCIKGQHSDVNQCHN